MDSPKRLSVAMTSVYSCNLENVSIATGTTAITIGKHNYRFGINICYCL